LAQPAVHSRRGCNRDSTTTETAARAIRINTPPYASSVSARRVPDSSAGRSNDTRLMHAHRPRLLARPSQAIPCQGSTRSSASTKTHAVLSGQRLSRSGTPTARPPHRLCSLHAGPALPQSAPSVTQTNRPVPVSAPSQGPPTGPAVPVNPSQESVEAAKHTIDGRTRTRTLAGPTSMCTTGPTPVESVGPRHERTFYDGPRPENPSQPRFALLAYTEF
jgi:hypothetical protein